MPIPQPPSLIWTLQVDPPVEQDASYEFSDVDRSYIDDQIRGLETLVLQSLLVGVHATWLTLDPTSAAGAMGNVVCLTGNAAATVTLAVSSALSTSGGAVGILLRPANPGGMALVALEGVIAQSITGLAGSGVYARVNPSGPTAQQVSSIGSTDYPLGWVDAYGNLMLHPQIPTAGTGTLPSGSEGDLLVYHSGTWTSLAPGAEGDVLTSTGTSSEPTYQAPAESNPPIEVTVGTSATTTSTATIASGQRAYCIIVSVTTPYSSGTTVEVGYPGALGAFLASGVIDPTVATTTAIAMRVVLPSTQPVVVTIGGSPSAGAMTDTVFYATPTS